MASQASAIIEPSIWASSWGEDQWGVWADFSVSEVTQRLRWIKPGRFLMGAPGGEVGLSRHEEGPQHDVTIKQGFWMFDTPCTQALWKMVFGYRNPSDFHGPDRPVENVTSGEVETFITNAGELITGLNLALPSEALWEYACRAETTTATYAGNLEFLGDANVPVLDSIAWYAGNAGVGFDVKSGRDLNRFYSDRQHSDSSSGRHPVGQKAPNPWGLYDMIGNAWEMCADRWHDNFNGAPDDGGAWLHGGKRSTRVTRGGAWYTCPGSLRAASRAGMIDHEADPSTGFRCIAPSHVDAEFSQIQRNVKGPSI